MGKWLLGRLWWSAMGAFSGRAVTRRVSDVHAKGERITDHGAPFPLTREWRRWYAQDRRSGRRDGGAERFAGIHGHGGRGRAPAGLGVRRRRLGAAPGCVDVKKTHQDEGYKAFKVKNNCSSTKRLKGVFKYGYDSPCTPVKPGKSALLTSMQPWVDYDKVVTC
ncbi:hypothetical protein AB0F36_23345 [Streptomyces sp. NPDC029080]|uniref:hypothetical protein n=1 Tax=Streptomyces sp. NPDC029080 TaxID=3155017 RepID=UPI0033CF0758